jgi:hypothetical protein
MVIAQMLYLYEVIPKTGILVSLRGGDLNLQVDLSLQENI